MKGNASQGMVLPVALILMAVMAVSATAVFRTSLVSGAFGNNQRLQHLALQAAEAALAHCEAVATEGADNGSTAADGPQASVSPAGEPRLWTSLDSWHGRGALAIDVPIPAMEGQAVSPRRPAQCLIEKMTLAGAANDDAGGGRGAFFQVTARGFGPDQPEDQAAASSGSQVWLQSVVWRPPASQEARGTGKAGGPAIVVRSRAVQYQPSQSEAASPADASPLASSSRRVDATQQEAAMPWEFNAANDAAMGEAIANVETGVMRNGRQAVLFGNGVGGQGGIARLYVLDLATGHLMRHIDAHPGPANGLTGVRAARDADGRIVAAYAGDLLGHLWRFDLSSDTPSQWQVALDGKPLFTAVDAEGVPQAFATAPQVVPHPQGGLLVVGATGLPPVMAAGASTGGMPQQQSLYGIWDRSRGGVPSSASGGSEMSVKPDQLAVHKLVAMPDVEFQAVIAQKIDWKQQRGWHLPLPSGVSATQGASFVRGVVRFRLATADPAEQIELQLDPVTGGMTREPLFDVNGDGVVNSLDGIAAGVRVRAGNMAADEREGALLKTPSGRLVTLDHGEYRPGRNWRQIVNFPR